MHPIMAAKQATTIDHVTGGRFALNIVTGWYRPEIEMFGAPQMDHDVRYDCAVEWLDIIKRLWTEDEEFDFDGKLLPRSRRASAAQADPEAVSGRDECGRLREGPPLRGQVLRRRLRRFSIPTTLDGMPSSVVSAIAELAREEYGRDLQVWTDAYVVQGETEKEARDFFDYYVHRRATGRRSTNLVETMGINAQILPPEVERR